MSISWLAPWVYLLLPLPWLLAWWLPQIRGSTWALRVPFLAQLQRRQDAHARLWQTWWRHLLAAFIWLACVSAAAGPVYLSQPVELPYLGRQLMLVVDLSGSMEIQDADFRGQKLTRLQAVKSVVGEFVQARGRDQVGLVVFGDQPYLYVPLTLDHALLVHQLNQLQARMAGNATAIGDALGLAVKKLLPYRQERTLILLTDGQNNAGTLSPEEALQLAASEGIRVYTIAFGDQNIAQEQQGWQSLITAQGGRLFQASNLAELHSVYQVIQQLEPASQARWWQAQTSLSIWCLLAAIAAWLLGAMLHGWQNRREASCKQ